MRPRAEASRLRIQAPLPKPRLTLSHLHVRPCRLLNGGTLGEHLNLRASAKEAPSETSDDQLASYGGSVSSSTKSSKGSWSGTPSSELLQLAKDVALGLHYLHTNGVTHRDVKNANVMIDCGQRVRAKLCDFGIAALVSPSRSEERSAPNGLPNPVDQRAA